MDLLQVFTVDEEGHPQLATLNCAFCKDPIGEHAFAVAGTGELFCKASCLETSKQLGALRDARIAGRR